MPPFVAFLLAIPGPWKSFDGSDGGSYSAPGIVSDALAFGIRLLDEGHGIIDAPEVPHGLVPLGVEGVDASLGADLLLEDIPVECDAAVSGPAPLGRLDRR